MGNRKTNLMTEGVIWKQFVLFSIPLLIGNLFQQLYNTVDSVVVGNFIGRNALAAVGSSNSLINLIIGMFMGIATGAGVIIAQYYGGGQDQKLGRAVHTCMAVSVTGGVLLIFLGVVLSPLILRWMGTPEEVLPSSVAYLRIFFCGSLFNLVYNMGAGILRAVGDSIRPLIYLCAASLVNMVLDLVFVVVFRMGTAGVGYATIIAQGVSAALTVRALTATDGPYRLILSQIRIDRRMLGRILRIGIPSGIQQSIISLSNVIVQSNINGYGPLAMAGYGAYNKIDGFVILPLQSFCMAATTFVGQNLGAGKNRRIKEGMFQASVLSVVYAVFVTAVLYRGADRILGIFSKDPGVIQYGHLTMAILLPFYWVMSIHQILMGAFRGAGKTMAAMAVTVGNMCILRMIYINFMVPFFPSFEAVMWCYPITWATTLAMDIAYCVKVKWLPKETVKKEQIKV